jgi:thioredoxin 2
MATMVAGDLEVSLDERGLIVSCAHCGKRNRLTYERLGQTFRCGDCRNELDLPATPIDVHSHRDFEFLSRRSSLPILVDFWAPWCGPCKMVAPELAKVAANSNGQFLVAKVNTEELPITAQQFRISAIPTLVLFRDGRELARKPGALPAAAIFQFLSNFGA